jgi:transcriptional regulator with XRE-family HTH domain
MRLSAKRHNLARLRLFVNLRQKEMAEVCGCSVDTIQSIELGRKRLALSENLARKISKETGIAAEWLLENDLRAALLGDDYQPFTIERYNERRTLRDLGWPAAGTEFVSVSPDDPMTIIFYAWMRSIFATRDGDLALWQTGKFLEKLAEKYGHWAGIKLKGPLKIAALRDPYVRWQQAHVGMQLAEKCVQKWRKRRTAGFHAAKEPEKPQRSRAKRRQPNKSRVATARFCSPR